MADSSAGTPAPGPGGRRGLLVVLALIVVFVMILVLARCASSGTNPTSAPSTAVSSETTAEQNDEPSRRATPTRPDSSSPSDATTTTARPPSGSSSAPPTKATSSEPPLDDTTTKRPDTAYVQVIMHTRFEVDVSNDRNGERCAQELDAGLSSGSSEKPWCTLPLPIGGEVRLTAVLSGTPTGVWGDREPEREPTWYGCQEGDGSSTCTVDLTGGHWVCLASQDVSEALDANCEGLRDSGLLASIPPGSTEPPGGLRPPGS